MASLLLLLLLVVVALSFVSDCLNEEGHALLSLKSAVSRDPYSSLGDWTSTDSDPCSWNGITCNSLRSVVSISLPRRRLLSSSLPASAFVSLPSLRHLNLRENLLSGPLPPSLISLPSLRSLVLLSNSFSGSLPPFVSSLPLLQVLDVSRNSLSGPLPPSLLLCGRLRTIVISNNSFSGEIPAGFGSSFPSLEKLDLSHNLFTGPIPVDIGKLSSLQETADFSHNRFSGEIPPSLGDLPEKVYIDLSYNTLAGPIPQIGALSSRGPTAFLGNPGLCGPPLKNPCSPDNTAPAATKGNTTTTTTYSRTKGMSKAFVVAIVVGDIAGILLIAMAFFYCYQRATEKMGSKRSEKTKESETPPQEEVEQPELVALDGEVGFDLDELLKASAFLLGKSRIGIMYRVVLAEGTTLAVRRLGEGGSQRFKEFKVEVEAIGKVRHPNIIKLRAYYWSMDEKLLVYDYIPNGNLSSAIHGKPGTATFSPLTWDVRLKIIKGVAKGLVFLHEFSPKKYVHGDLKPNNILLGTNMDPYISDFGLGRLINIGGWSPLPQSNKVISKKHDKERSGVPISPIVNISSRYQAPDAFKSLRPSQKWDVYSYGVILLELISGWSSPTAVLDTSKVDLVEWVQFCIDEKKPLSDVLDPFLAREVNREDEIIGVLKIALACVRTNPDRRPSMRHVVDALSRIKHAR